MIKVLLHIAAICAVVASAASCRTIRKATSEVTATPANTDPYCQPAAEKSLACQVRDLVPRYGSKLEAVKSSQFSQVTDVAITVFADGAEKEPLVELRAKSEREPLLVFERTSDLYRRNGCLSEVTGGVFLEGFTPRVTLKLLMSSQSADHAAVAEISDFRHSTPLHLSLDLQCERKKL